MTVGNITSIKFKNHRFFKNIKEWTGEKIEKNIVVFNEQGWRFNTIFKVYIPLTKLAQNVTFAVQTIFKVFLKKIFTTYQLEQ